MKSIRLNGARICYEEDGTRDAPIVFVHGWCCNHRYFAPQYAHFSARHHVLALDQRGFGDSDKPEQKYTIEGFADDVAALCRELGLERPALVGHSMGGAIVLAVAAKYPTLPRAIALCDPAVFFPDFMKAAIAPFLEGLASADYKQVAGAFVEQRLFGPSDDAARRLRITSEMCQTPQHVMSSAFQNLIAFDSESAARACKVPVLLIDAEAPIPDRARFKEACPQLATAQTAGAGHFHQLEVPDQVNAMLERFFYTVR
ncbi:MAG TPA: alpha/beta hydrolase [Myxococcota bacterium]|nr:alpha/beta hydrolase [Myxococcota bacterium]